MVQTITPVVHGGRRSRWGASLAFHVLGAAVSAAAFGAALGAGGSVLGAPWGRLGGILVGGTALVYAAREAFGLAVPVPDRRRQVPEWWRSHFSPNTSAFLYGLGLGVGFLTYVRYGTLVAVSAAAIASGDAVVGAIVLAPFGLVRGLSVAVVWTGDSHERVQRVADRIGSLAQSGAPRIMNSAILVLLGLTALVLPFEEGGETATFVGAWALAVAFAWAAAAKTARPSEWRETLSAHSLPPPLEVLAFRVVPLAEAAVPALALSGRPRPSAAVALTLLIVFSAAILRARRLHGPKVPCGCFGKRALRDYRFLLLRNAALGAAAATVFLGGSGRPLLEGLRGPRVSEAVPALLVLAGVALITSVAGQILGLRRATR
jgi:Methylamine utilisation protein MauE